MLINIHFVPCLRIQVDMPRTATVTATEKCLLLVLGIDDFRNFLHVVPELKVRVELLLTIACGRLLLYRLCHLLLPRVRLTGSC